MPAYSKTEALNQTISLTRILQWDIDMPCFQRPFRWGLPDGRTKSERKAIEYFNSFLVNRNANAYFGNVFVYGFRRYDYHRDPQIAVCLADGQHRVATVAIAARVFVERLQEVLQDEQNDEHDRDAAKEYLREEALALSTNGNIKTVVAMNRREPILKFIDDTKAKLARLERQKKEVDDRYTEECAALRARRDLRVLDRKKLRQELTQSKNAELEKIKKQIKVLEAIPLYNAYVQIQAELAGKPVGVTLRLARTFIDRIEGLRVGLLTLQPGQGQHVDDIEIEIIAFEMFTQMNGDATPLSAGEMLSSWVSTQAPADHALRRYLDLEQNSSESRALNFFGIRSVEDLARYFPRAYARKHTDPDDAFTWVRGKLYGTPDVPAQLSMLEQTLAQLSTAHRVMGHATEPLSSLSALLFSIVDRQATALFVSRVLASGSRTVQEQDLRRLFKLLVLMELMTTYSGSGPKRRNARMFDLVDVTPTITAGLRFVCRHFGVDSREALAQRLIEHLVEFPFGHPNYRELGKLLLVVVDADKHGSAVQLSAWRNFDYEHVLPTAYAGLSTEPDVPEHIAQSLESFEADPAAGTLIDMIGNGALLDGSANSGFGRLPPYRKLIKTEDKDYCNAWWGTNLAALRDSKGDWSAEFIRARSSRIVNECVRYLTSPDMGEPERSTHEEGSART